MSPFKLLLLVAAGSHSAFAAVSVNWISPTNSIKQQDGTTNAPRTWMAQLIWSPDDIPSVPSLSDPFLPGGGEIVLRSIQLSTSTDGRIVSGKVVADDALAGGFVYTRVFNVDFNGGSPSTPTHYGNSPVVTGGLVIETTDPSTVLNHWTSSAARLVVNQAVPEPSSCVFLCSGALALGLRRRRTARVATRPA